MNEDRIISWRSWVTTLALMLVAATILWVLRTQQFTGDSLWYARDALAGARMFHPHHLWYTPFLRLLHQWFQLIGLTGSILITGQAMNVGFASLSLGLMHRTLLRHVNRKTALGTCVLILFSYGFWTFSTQIEVYIAALFFALALMTIVTQKENISIFMEMGCVASFALAILFHQTSVLLAVPLLVVLGRTQLGKWFRIVGATGILVIAAYLLAMRIDGHPLSYPGFIDFCLNYAKSAEPDWGAWSNLKPLGWFRLMASQIGNIIRPQYSKVAVYWIVFVLGMVWGVYRSWVRWRARDETQRIIGFCMVWLMTNFLFFLWWLPQEGEFFIVTLIPLWVLFALTIDGISHRFSKWVVPALALVLLVFNVAGFSERHYQPSAHGKRAAEIAEKVDSNCYVITDFFTQQDLAFFHGMHGQNLDVLEKAFSADQFAQDLQDKQSVLISAKHFARMMGANSRNALSVLGNMVEQVEEEEIGQEPYLLLSLGESPLGLDEFLKQCNRLVHKHESPNAQ